MLTYDSLLIFSSSSPKFKSKAPTFSPIEGPPIPSPPPSPNSNNFQAPELGFPSSSSRFPSSSCRSWVVWSGRRGSIRACGWERDGLGFVGWCALVVCGLAGAGGGAAPGLGQDVLLAVHTGEEGSAGHDLDRGALGEEAPEEPGRGYGHRRLRRSVEFVRSPCSHCFLLPFFVVRVHNWLVGSLKFMRWIQLWSCLLLSWWFGVCFYRNLFYFAS